MSKVRPILGVNGFQFDAIANGRTVKILNAIDELYLLCRFFRRP